MLLRWKTNRVWLVLQNIHDIVTHQFTCNVYWLFIFCHTTLIENNTDLAIPSIFPQYSSNYPLKFTPFINNLIKNIILKYRKHWLKRIKNIRIIKKYFSQIHGWNWINIGFFMQPLYTNKRTQWTEKLNNFL